MSDSSISSDGSAKNSGSDLRTTYGSANHPNRSVIHSRPEGSSDAEVDAVGKVSAAFEVIENARGMLYQFHRMSGMADLQLQEGIEALRTAGHDELAAEVEEVLVGRDVVRDMWTFQIVENYDEQYYEVFRAVDAKVRSVLSGGVPHVFEAEMKLKEQGGSKSAG